MLYILHEYLLLLTSAIKMMASVKNKNYSAEKLLIEATTDTSYVCTLSSPLSLIIKLIKVVFI